MISKLIWDFFRSEIHLHAYVIKWSFVYPIPPQIALWFMYDPYYMMDVTFSEMLGMILMNNLIYSQAKDTIGILT